jgi:hypothetical protein
LPDQRQRRQQQPKLLLLFAVEVLWGRVESELRAGWPGSPPLNCGSARVATAAATAAAAA